MIQTTIDSAACRSELLRMPTEEFLKDLPTELQQVWLEKYKNISIDPSNVKYKNYTIPPESGSSKER